MATMPRTPLRIGFVGTRRGAVYGSVFNAHEHCQIAAGCDIDAAYLEPFQRQFNLPDSRCFSNYDDFLNVGLDVVVIGTPIPCHAVQAIGALDAGAHVLSEVTAASNIEQCREIIDAVARTGKKYMLAENCNYWPFIQEWQKIVAAGRLGDIFYSECEYLHPTPILIVDPQTQEKKWRASAACRDDDASRKHRLQACAIPGVQARRAAHKERRIRCEPCPIAVGSAASVSRRTS